MAPPARMVNRSPSPPGVAVFKVAFDRWVDKNGKQERESLIPESLAELKVLVGV